MTAGDVLSAALAAEVTLPSVSDVAATVEELDEATAKRWAARSLELGSDDAADLAALLLVERPELEAPARARAEARAASASGLDDLSKLSPTAFWALHQRVHDEMWSRLEGARDDLRQRLAGRSS